MNCLMCYHGLVNPDIDEDLCENCLLIYNDNIEYMDE